MEISERKGMENENRGREEDCGGDDWRKERDIGEVKKRKGSGMRREAGGWLEGDLLPCLPHLSCLTCPVLSRFSSHVLPHLSCLTCPVLVGSPVLSRFGSPVLSYSTSPVLSHLSCHILPHLSCPVRLHLSCLTCPVPISSPVLSPLAHLSCLTCPVPISSPVLSPLAHLSCPVLPRLPGSIPFCLTCPVLFRLTLSCLISFHLPCSVSPVLLSHLSLSVSPVLFRLVCSFLSHLTCHHCPVLLHLSSALSCRIPSVSSCLTARLSRNFVLPHILFSPPERCVA
ncbi:hypothetical protein Pcinc_034687 [Petrolisthes cinctipes]|uniref:Uncharacterized protein n=1 Tax=Petrolisthes cinctipes TaxID=88211 RepID=A0AAE1BY48_PETCI|nr:hypothetical protein Pcinc_034687 [Petrolisthes cinctipes]